VRALQHRGEVREPRREDALARRRARRDRALRAQGPRGDGGRVRLLKGRDAAKDQSYFLFGLTPAQLETALFPVGDLDKAEVRRIARERGLPTADKAESQEICFVPDGDYASFVERQAGAADRSGPIVDPGGRQIGSHAGVHRFTVGQRRGLGLTTNRPHYVLAVEPATATLVVGDESGLLRSELSARGVNWLSRPAPEVELRARVGSVTDMPKPTPPSVRSAPMRSTSSSTRLSAP
jgi:tRNA-specific 2-thiouridylase